MVLEGIGIAAIVVGAVGLIVLVASAIYLNNASSRGRHKKREEEMGITASAAAAKPTATMKQGYIVV